MSKLVSKLIIIKRVTSLDWQEYKKIRLEALKKEPQAFGSSYDKEKERSENEWKEKIAKSENFNSLSFFMQLLGKMNLLRSVAPTKIKMRGGTLSQFILSKSLEGKVLGRKCFRQ
jgi:hypothetical protein